MRLPSIITNLGYSCGKIDFPAVRYRPPIPKSLIMEKSELGIFHPVWEYYLPNL